MDSRAIFSRWVRATWGGWVLGVPVIIAIALAGEAIGIGGTQVLVGAGMGVGVGLMQGRAIRAALDASLQWPWFWSCVIGLALPFLAIDLANVIGRSLPYSLQISVAAAGIVVGVWQARLLQSRVRNAAWWILGSVLGWTLAAGMTAISDSLFQSQSLRGLSGAAAYLGIIAGGGLVLGIVTGTTLVSLPRREPTL